MTLLGHSAARTGKEAESTSRALASPYLDSLQGRPWTPVGLKAAGSHVADHLVESQTQQLETHGWQVCAGSPARRETFRRSCGLTVRAPHPQCPLPVSLHITHTLWQSLFYKRKRSTSSSGFRLDWGSNLDLPSGSCLRSRGLHACAAWLGLVQCVRSVGTDLGPARSAGPRFLASLSQTGTRRRAGVSGSGPAATTLTPVGPDTLMMKEPSCPPVGRCAMAAAPGKTVNISVPCLHEYALVCLPHQYHRPGHTSCGAFRQARASRGQKRLAPCTPAQMWTSCLSPP